MEMQKRHFDTLVEASNTLLKEGYEHNFKAESKGIRDTDTDELYDTGQIKVVESHRFEGMANPSDSAQILAIEAEDGVKGTLVHSHGAKHSQDADMLRELQESIVKN